MPGFNPQQLQYKAQNSNSCVVLVGDQPIAFAQTVSHTFTFGTESLYGVGNAKPQEIQQLRISPEITLDNFALSALGNNLVQGGVVFSSIIANNQFNIVVVDGNTGAALYTYVGCVARNFSESIAANRPLTDAIGFDALDVLDQSGQSILNGQNAFSLSGQVAGVVNGGLGVTVTAAL